MADHARALDLVELFHRAPAFRELGQQHLEKLAPYATEMSWPSDQFIFREGEPDDRLYVVLDGLVALETYIPNRGRVTIQTIGPNEILGWSAAVPRVEKKTASARTLLATQAVAFDAEALQAACDADCDLGYHLYRTLATVIASRLKATRLQLVDMYAIGERK